MPTLDDDVYISVKAVNKAVIPFIIISYGINILKKVNIKDNLILQLKDQRIINNDFLDLNNIARSACFACRYFSNVYADISFGGVGSPDRYLTSLIRTEKGEDICNDSLKKGYLQEPFNLNGSIKKSEMLAKVISFGKRKFNMYKNTLKEKADTNKIVYV